MSTPIRTPTSSASAELTAQHEESVSTAQAGPQLPWYEWYPSDFAGSYLVQAMTVPQELAYRRLLDAAWTMRCPCFLPNDPQVLALIARMTDLQWGTDGRIVLEMFSLSDDRKFLYHPKQLDIYRRSRKINDARRKGGQSRSQQMHPNAADDVPSTPPSTPDSSPASSADSKQGAVLDTTTTTTTTTTTKNKTNTGGLDRYQLASAIVGRLQIPGSKALFTAISDAIKIKAEVTSYDEQDVARDLCEKAVLFRKVRNPRWSLLMFFQEGAYDHDPRTWEKGYIDVEQQAGSFAGRTAGAGESRTRHNLSAAERAIQREYANAEASGHSAGGDSAGSSDQGNG